MTDWTEYTPADFDAAKAPKYVRQNAGAGQESLFATGTPTVPAKRTAREELSGQGGLFGDGTEDVSGVIGAGGLVYSDADPGL
jgi:hypothetical protein